MFWRQIQTGTRERERERRKKSKSVKCTLRQLLKLRNARKGRKNKNETKNANANVPCTFTHSLCILYFFLAQTLLPARTHSLALTCTHAHAYIHICTYAHAYTHTQRSKATVAVGLCLAAAKSVTPLVDSSAAAAAAQAATTTMLKGAGVGAALVESARERESVGKKTIAKLQLRANGESMFAQLAGKFVRCDFLCCCQLVRSSPILHNFNNSNNKPLSHSKHSKMRKTAALQQHHHHHQVRVSCVLHCVLGVRTGGRLVCEYMPRTVPLSQAPE